MTAEDKKLIAQMIGEAVKKMTPEPVKEGEVKLSPKEVLELEQKKINAQEINTLMNTMRMANERNDIEGMRTSYNAVKAQMIKMTMFAETADDYRNIQLKTMQLKQLKAIY